MKQALYILAAIVLFVIAAKIFVWALKTVIILAVIAVVVFVAVKMLAGKKSGD
jgi:hypothetical protein